MARRAASHYPDSIFGGTRRSGGPEGNPRTSEDPFRVSALVFARPLGRQPRNLILSCRRAPAHLPPASPARSSRLASQPGRWGSTEPPPRSFWGDAAALASALLSPPHAPLSAQAAASWAVAAQAEQGLLAAPRGRLPGTGPRTHWFLRSLRVGLGRPRPEERPPTTPRHIPPHPLSGFCAFLPERPYTLNGSSLPASLELPLEALGLNINQPEL